SSDLDVESRLPRRVADLFAPLFGGRQRLFHDDACPCAKRSGDQVGVRVVGGRDDNSLDLLLRDHPLEVCWPVVTNRLLPRVNQAAIVVLHPAWLRVAPGDELCDLSALAHAGLDQHLGPVAGSYDGVASPRVRRHYFSSMSESVYAPMLALLRTRWSRLSAKRSAPRGDRPRSRCRYSRRPLRGRTR